MWICRHSIFSFPHFTSTILAVQRRSRTKTGWKVWKCSAKCRRVLMVSSHCPSPRPIRNGLYRLVLYGGVNTAQWQTPTQDSHWMLCSFISISICLGLCVGQCEPWRFAENSEFIYLVQARGFTEFLWYPILFSLTHGQVSLQFRDLQFKFLSPFPATKTIQESLLFTYVYGLNYLSLTILLCLS